MLNELIKLYERCHHKRQSLILEITHDKICDWSIYIQHRDSATTIYDGNGDLNEQTWRAYLALKEWRLKKIYSPKKIGAN